MTRLGFMNINPENMRHRLTTDTIAKLAIKYPYSLLGKYECTLWSSYTNGYEYEYEYEYDIMMITVIMIHKK